MLIHLFNMTVHFKLINAKPNTGLSDFRFGSNHITKTTFFENGNGYSTL